MYFKSSYQLTGWNIDLNIKDNRLRLKSRYAESKDDTIELEWYELNDFEFSLTT